MAAFTRQLDDIGAPPTKVNIPTTTGAGIIGGALPGLGKMLAAATGHGKGGSGGPTYAQRGAEIDRESMANLGDKALQYQSLLNAGKITPAVAAAKNAELVQSALGQGMAFNDISAVMKGITGEDLGESMQSPAQEAHMKMIESEEFQTGYRLARSSGKSEEEANAEAMNFVLGMQNAAQTLQMDNVNAVSKAGAVDTLLDAYQLSFVDAWTQKAEQMGGMLTQADFDYAQNALVGIKDQIFKINGNAEDKYTKETMKRLEGFEKFIGIIKEASDPGKNLERMKGNILRSLSQSTNKKATIEEYAKIVTLVNDPASLQGLFASADVLKGLPELSQVSNHLENKRQLFIDAANNLPNILNSSDAAEKAGKDLITTLAGGRSIPELDEAGGLNMGQGTRQKYTAKLMNAVNNPHTMGTDEGVQNFVYLSATYAADLASAKHRTSGEALASQFNAGKVEMALQNVGKSDPNQEAMLREVYRQGFDNQTVLHQNYIRGFSERHGVIYDEKAQRFKLDPTRPDAANIRRTAEQGVLPYRGAPQKFEMEGGQVWLKTVGAEYDKAQSSIDAMSALKANMETLAPKDKDDLEAMEKLKKEMAGGSALAQETPEEGAVYGDNAKFFVDNAKEAAADVVKAEQLKKFEEQEQIRIERETEAADPIVREANADIGSISAKYESRGDFTAFGRDRTGGPSYGKYQIATKTGTFNNYMGFLKKRHPDTYKQLQEAGGAGGARTGSKAFQSAFKKIMSDPKNAATQHEFIKATHYDKAVKKLGSSFNEASASKSMKDVVWSLAVQHGSGGAAKIYKRAVQKVGPMASERELIIAIYEERGANGGKKYFGRSTAQVQAAVSRRFKNELQDALKGTS